ncbi:bifunctional glycosyltransferase family 2/GtrA family protein [Paenibacillus sp. HW567]|uniref:bifunctional glycosyltransferase family 2/GtrA family protein n=1 Tax=Paenibacillus sp. HW567 TaxID=1034769 RepID=UPI00035DA553|nr:bifunctional glycosyltransferase family 2/GtrA family protein [Paenibacillus sp. HW567]
MKEYNSSFLKEATRYVVIPAFQPPEQLVNLVHDITAAGYEVLIVNDGSSSEFDAMWDILKSKATVIHHSVNRGKGAALKTAFQYLSDNISDTGLIVTMDADGQHLPKDMEAVIETAAANEHSLVLGVRQFDKTVPARSRFGNKITRAVFSAVSKARVSDTQTGLRAFDHSLLDFMLQIPGERYEYEMNMLLQCDNHGISMLERPIDTVYLDRQNSLSHFNAIKDSIRIYRTIFKFASISLLSFAIDYVAFLVLASLTAAIPYHFIISNIVARTLSATVNYTLNKNTVFHKKKSVTQTLPQYVLLAFGILIANSIFLSFFTRIVGFPPYLSKILTELLLFIISFLVQSLIIFKSKDFTSQANEEVKHA